MLELGQHRSAFAIYPRQAQDPLLGVLKLTVAALEQADAVLIAFQGAFKGELAVFEIPKADLAVVTSAGEKFVFHVDRQREDVIVVPLERTHLFLQFGGIEFVNQLVRTPRRSNSFTSRGTPTSPANRPREISHGECSHP